MPSRLGCTAELHCRHRSSWHPNFQVSTGSPALLSAATCSLCEFHVWSAKLLLTCACLWQSCLNIGTVVAVGFIYPGPELLWKFAACSVELSKSTCWRSCFCRASSPPRALTDSGGVLLFLEWKASLWEHVFLKVMEKRPSNHINRGETRPNLLKEAKEYRAVPCVGLCCLWPEPCCVVPIYFPFSRWYYKIKTGHPNLVQPVFNVFALFC